MDTPHGVHFSRDPRLPLLPLVRQKMPLKDRIVDDGSWKKMKFENHDNKANTEEQSEFMDEGDTNRIQYLTELSRQRNEAYPLVTEEDRLLITDAIFLALENMEPCRFTENDRVGVYKDRNLGFRGFACKHCDGHAGAGRYFPCSEGSLAQTTTSVTFVNHIRRCRYVPREIRDKLDLLALQSESPENSGPKKIRHKLLDRPLHGGRKVFFHRLWCRVQQLPIHVTDEVELAWGIRQAANKDNSQKEVIDSYSQDDFDPKKIKLTSCHDNQRPKRKETAVTSLRMTRKQLAHDNHTVDSDSTGSLKNDITDVRYNGCVPLCKGSDHAWIPAQQCFERASMIFVFAVDEIYANTLAEYMPVHLGQVGIICSFCYKINPSDRPKGCSLFPSSLSSLPSSWRSLKNHHLVNCSNIPEDVRSNHRSLSSMSVKPTVDMNQYIIDSARDLGLKDSSNGIYFFREPLVPSPADMIASRRKNHSRTNVPQSTLILSDDLADATDYQLLLLDQYKYFQCHRPQSISRPKYGFSCIYCDHDSGKFVAKNFRILWYNIIRAKKMDMHILNCSKSPESIKASIAYLSHSTPSMRMKVTKKAKGLYMRIWERTQQHQRVSHKDQKIIEQDEDDKDESDDDEINDKNISDNDALDDYHNDSNSEMSVEMTKMVETAAKWMTEQENPSDPVSRTIHPHKARPRGRSRPPK
jgi:hypothetical protein